MSLNHEAIAQKSELLNRFFPARFTTERDFLFTYLQTVLSWCANHKFKQLLSEERDIQLKKIKSFQAMNQEAVISNSTPQ